MPQDYLWTAEALAEIKSKGLDGLFRKNKARYEGFATKVWEPMKDAAGPTAELQKANLHAVLRGLIDLDTKLGAALRSKGIFAARRKWISWFTWYVIEKSWEGLP